MPQHESVEKSLMMIMFMMMCTSLVSTHSDASANKVEVDHKRIDIWGPGLNIKSQLPSRYLYIQLYSKQGTRLTESGGSVEVKLTVADGRRFGGRSQVLDRKDGSYIVNYRPSLPMNDVNIHLSLGGKTLGDSPYKLDGWMYQENCNCPLDSADEWVDALQCPESFSQLDEDLAPFSDIDMREVEREVHRRWPKRPGTGALMHYVIKNNRVYRKEVGSICGFKMFSDSILLSLLRKVDLPDVEFFINLGDWPLVKDSDSNIPIISWCGSNKTTDIILPTYDITDASLKSLSQVSIDLFTVQATNSPRWEEKIPKGLFRGRDSRKERLDLARLAREGKNSELIDVGITRFFFFPKDESIQSDRIDFFDFFKYKYQLNVDGTVAAYRFPYLMSSDSLVMKQDSIYYEYFYRDLLPWQHYIPLRSDLSDVLDQVKWAKEHDEEAKKIAENGREYMRNNVTPANIYCYYYRAITKLASKIKSAVEIQEGMEEATHPDYMSHCKCHRDTSRRHHNSATQQPRAADEL